jgi:hypothetical protein
MLSTDLSSKFAGPEIKAEGRRTMRDETLIPIISGADALDEEDVFLRCALVVALRDLSASERAEGEAGAEDVASEDHGDAAVDDGWYGGVLALLQLAHRRTARARLRCGWAIAASLAAAVMLGGVVAWSGKPASECRAALNWAPLIDMQ